MLSKKLVGEFYKIKTKSGEKHLVNEKYTYIF